MVKNWIMGAASLPLSIALLVATAGCGGEGIEQTGEAKGALDPMFDYMHVLSGGHVSISVHHVAYNNGYFKLRYGRVGSPMSTVYSSTGHFELQSLAVGAPYTFSATECHGLPMMYGSTCAQYTDPVAQLLPYDGTTWGLSTDLSQDDLASAWDAGSLVVNGAAVPVQACSMLHGDGALPGYFYGGQCNGLADGAAVTDASAYVLQKVSGTPTWGDYGNGFIHPGAVISGYYGGRPAYTCRTQVADQSYVPGYTFGKECYSVYNNAPLVTPASGCQMLYLN